MKLSIKIFAFYLMILSIVPCGDGGGGILEIVNHLFNLEHNHVSSHEKHSKDCGDDTCTVFCVCTCCSSIIELPSEFPLNLSIPDTEITKTKSFHPKFYESLFLTSIWQPPKFS